MKYIVELGYRKFEFADGVKALEFANTAKETVVEENMTVEITIENDEQEEKQDE